MPSAPAIVTSNPTPASLPPKLTSLVCGRGASLAGFALGVGLPFTWHGATAACLSTFGQLLLVGLLLAVSSLALAA